MSADSSSSFILTPEQKQREEKWKAQLTLLAKENAQLLIQLRGVAKDKTSMNQEGQRQQREIQKLESEIKNTHTELDKTRVSLRVTTDDLEHWMAKTQNGGESIDDLKSRIEDLQNEKEDSQSHVENLQNENGKLKSQMAALQQQVTSRDDRLQQLQLQIQQHLQLQQQQHVDPNQNNNRNNNQQTNNNNELSDETQALIQNLQKEVEELRSQRNYFMARDDKQNGKESRDVLELQQWSGLLKKMISSLSQVRSRWNSDIERDDQMRVLSEALGTNVGADDTHFILDALSRVSAQVKKSSNQTSQLMQAAVSQQNAVDVDSFTTHLRPTVVELLRLVHGTFSDSAYLWAMVRKFKQLENEWSRKEQELLKKKSGWFN